MLQINEKVYILEEYEALKVIFKTNIKILISCYVHYFDPKNGLKLKKKNEIIDK